MRDRNNHDRVAGDAFGRRDRPAAGRDRHYVNLGEPDLAPERNKVP